MWWLYLLALSFQLPSRTFSHTVACARPTWRPAALHSWASSGARSASRSKRASSSCLPRHQFQRARRTSRSRHSCPLWGQRRSRPEKGYFFIPTFISQKIYVTWAFFGTGANAFSMAAASHSWAMSTYYWDNHIWKIVSFSSPTHIFFRASLSAYFSTQGLNWWIIRRKGWEKLLICT